MKAKDETSEHMHQVRFIQWFKRNYPCDRIFAIPNGEKRSPATASKLKAQGVEKGVPDLFIPSLFIWVEMKKIDEKLSEDQKDWLMYLNDRGYDAIVGYGFEDARDKVLQILDKRKLCDSEINKTRINQYYYKTDDCLSSRTTPSSHPNSSETQHK